MATLTPQAPGVFTPVAATSGGDTLALGTHTSAVFYVNNASGSSITVTFAGINACNQGVLHNQVTTVAANTQETIVPLPQVIDQTPATRGNVTATYSAVTTVTVGVIAPS